MNGKKKCKILKEIRKEIARQNDIEYVTAECKFQGSCSGTCPKCEAEVRYLEQELDKRKHAGKAVTVAGIAAALLVSTTACVPSAEHTQQTTEAAVSTESTEATETELQGDLAQLLPGSILLPEETTAGVPEETLMGEPVWTEFAGEIEGE